MLELKVFFVKVYQVSINKNLKILITGGAGMIGSNLVKKLVKNGFNVFVADNLWRGKKEYLFSEKKELWLYLRKIFIRLI